jgi:hypothetical protein
VSRTVIQIAESVTLQGASLGANIIQFILSGNFDLFHIDSQARIVQAPAIFLAMSEFKPFGPENCMHKSPIDSVELSIVRSLHVNFRRSWMGERIDNPQEFLPETAVKKPRKVHGAGPEAHRVIERLSGFDLENSRAWQGITKQFTIGVTRTELKAVAQVVCSLTQFKLDRDATRDNRVLVKWFDENWEVIEPHLKSFHLRDESSIVLGMPAYLQASNG